MKSIQQALRKKKEEQEKDDKVHIQVTMKRSFHKSVEEVLKENGDKWQEVLHTALELYVKEAKEEKARK